MHPLDSIKTARSLTAKVFEAMRADILACRLKPGQRLKIGEFCTRYDVSLGAIREALSRLAAEGLVIAEAQKGFHVAPVSKADLADLTTARIEIEGLTLRRAILYGDVAWESGIVAAFERLARTPERVDGDPAQLSEAWAEAHAAFHAALAAGCNSQWMQRMRSLLYEQAERYRRLSVPAGRKKRGVNEEHRAIMEAALRRDADGAAGLLAEHIRATSRVLISLATESEAAAEASQKKIA